MLNKNIIKQTALSLGFDGCGIAKADSLPESEYPLSRWLDSNYCADMDYMRRNADKRRDVRLLYEGVKSVVCVYKGYNPSSLMHGSAKVARYAYSSDYHTSIKQLLFSLAQSLGVQGKVCVDTSPISDKHWAARSGLGWIGWHTLLITPDWGSWVNLGELLLTEECDSYDNPIPNQCSSCRKCVQACPNHALVGTDTPMLNANLCTAYYTIESKHASLPEDLSTKGYIFGCDICQLACPYNSPDKVKSRHISTDRIHQLESLPDMDEQQYRSFIKGSAMERIKYSTLKRNLTKK